MREIILDLTNVKGEPCEDLDVYGARRSSGEYMGFADSEALNTMENLLLDYAGKVIRVKVTKVQSNRR